MCNALGVGSVDTADAYCPDILLSVVALVEISQYLSDPSNPDDVFGVLLGVCGIQCADS